jgi:hypothetical protein
MGRPGWACGQVQRVTSKMCLVRTVRTRNNMGIRFLLGEQVDVDATDKEHGWTAVHMAVEHNDMGILSSQCWSMERSQVREHASQQATDHPLAAFSPYLTQVQPSTAKTTRWWDIHQQETTASGWLLQLQQDPCAQRTVHSSRLSGG